MSDRVSKSLQLLIAGRQLDVAVFQAAVQSPDLFLSALAVGDVANGARNQDAFLRFERTKTDFNREFAAIPAKAVQFDSGAHGSDVGLSEEARPVRWVAGAEAFRHEDLDFLIEQFLALVAEQLFHLGVDQNDLARAIHYHH